MVHHRRYEALDGLRGVCALSVILFHLRVAGSPTELPFFRHADRFVEFFFVLSGFVIAYSGLKRSRYDLPDFIRARIFRLVPLHLALLMLFVGLEVIKAWAQARHLPTGGPAFSGRNAPAQILPNALLLQSWLPWADSLSFNAPSWSISAELYMYAVFALTLLLPDSIRLVIWTIIPILTLWSIHMRAGPLTLESLRGLSCFFAGVVTYCVGVNVFRYWRPGHVTGTIVEGACAVAVITILSFGYVDELIIVPLFVFVVSFFACERGYISSLLRTPALQSLGVLSFSIYMVHYLVIIVFTYALMISDHFRATSSFSIQGSDRLIDLGSGIATFGLVVSVVGCVIAVAAITRRCIERPGQAIGRHLGALARHVGTDRREAGSRGLGA